LQQITYNTEKNIVALIVPSFKNILKGCPIFSNLSSSSSGLFMSQNNIQQSKQKSIQRICDREAAKKPCNHQVEQPLSVRKYFFMLSTFM